MIYDSTHIHPQQMVNYYLQDIQATHTIIVCII